MKVKGNRLLDCLEEAQYHVRDGTVQGLNGEG